MPSNTASVAGFQNRRGTDQGPYSMTKYAVLSLSEELEIELEGTNVGVSVLAPGPVSTNIAQGARNRPADMGGAQMRERDEAILAERLRMQGTLIGGMNDIRTQSVILVFATSFCSC